MRVTAVRRIRELQATALAIPGRVRRRVMQIWVLGKKEGMGKG